MRNIRKIQLINAPNDSGATNSGNTSCFPHLGLLSIATHAREQHPWLEEIEVIDGSITPLEDILERVGGDVVGISVLTVSFATALQIAKRAKERGAYVVFGNDHASRCADAILRRRPYVDGVVIGDYGEVPFARIIDYVRGGRPLQEVPNFAARDGDGAVVLTGYRDFPLGDVSIPDRAFVEKDEVYQANYNRLYGKWHKTAMRATNTNFARGCAWGMSDLRRCTYCDIIDLAPRTVAPERAWAEIRQLRDRFGYNFVYEVCDSLTSFASSNRTLRNGFLDRLVDSKPDDIDTQWFVYGTAREITAEIVAKLKRLGVIRMNLGIDSGDPRMLRTLSKGNGGGPKDNLRAVELISNAGMQIYSSIVLGSIGETRESLHNTVRHVEQLVRHENVVALTSSVLIPLPGSPAWRMMMDPDFGRRRGKLAGFSPRYEVDFAAKYREIDALDMQEVGRDWVRCFCDVDFQTIWDASEEIRRIAGRSGAFTGGFGVKDF